MPNFINSNCLVKNVFLPKKSQLISSKCNYLPPLKNIYNSNVEISRQKTPLNELHTCQKLSLLVDKANIEQHYHDALLADFVYSRDFTTLEATQWGIERELARFLSKKTNIKLNPQHGLLNDSKTGLVAYIFHNKIRQEIRLVFGGTTSGEAVSGGAPRYMKNPRTFINQCNANIDNVFGDIPACYKQASQLLHHLQLLMQHEKWQKYTLSTSGHSLGGGLAAYSALKVSTTEKTIRAEYFCSAQLGLGLQKDLLAQYSNLANLKKVKEHINHYYVDGDIIPKLDKFFAVDHIGSVNIIPQIAEKKDSALAAHSRYVAHIRTLYQQAV